MAGRQSGNQALHPKGLKKARGRAARGANYLSSYGQLGKGGGQTDQSVNREKRLPVVTVGSCFPRSAGAETVRAKLLSHLGPEMASWSGDAHWVPHPSENALVFLLVRVLASARCEKEGRWNEPLQLSSKLHFLLL